jgi:DNA-binding NarL/FixJ family response regulator
MSWSARSSMLVRYILKSDANRSLIAAVDSLINGHAFFKAHISDPPLNDGHSPEHQKEKSPLAPRERVVAQLIAEGHSNREMGEILSLSIKTIESHRAAAMKKLKLTSAASLVRYVFRDKLLEL